MLTHENATRRPAIRRAAATVLLLGLLLTAGLGSPTTERASAASAASSRVTQCPYVAHDLRRLAALEKLTGERFHCALVYSDNMANWAEWERPWFAVSPHPEYQWDDWVRDSAGRNRLVMTFSMMPKGMPADWRRRGARGDYDEHIRRLAQNLVAAGLGSQVIRMGAEANGDWRMDQIGDTVTERRDWARYWARIVRVMRTVPGANFTFDWCINGGYRPIPFEQYYPGDDVVDIIGVDQYDGLTKQRTRDRWTEIRDQRGGLRDIAAFARSHRKPLSLPEVGLLSRSAAGAGDNPAYVRGLAAFVGSTDVAYVGYFDHGANGVLPLAKVPRSRTQWAVSFGDGATLDKVMAQARRRGAATR